MKAAEKEEYAKYSLFRKNLRRVRAVKGMTAKDFSELCKLRNPHRVSMLEEGRGCPSLEEVVQISEATGYSTDQLLFRKAIVTLIWE